MSSDVVLDVGSREENLHSGAASRADVGANVIRSAGA
jgi:hypothetical protein